MKKRDRLVTKPYLQIPEESLGDKASFDAFISTSLDEHFTRAEMSSDLSPGPDAIVTHRPITRAKRACSTALSITEEKLQDKDYLFERLKEAYRQAVDIVLSEDAKFFYDKTIRDGRGLISADPQLPEYIRNMRNRDLLVVQNFLETVAKTAGVERFVRWLEHQPHFYMEKGRTNVGGIFGGPRRRIGSPRQATQRMQQITQVKTDTSGLFGTPADRVVDVSIPKSARAPITEVPPVRDEAETLPVIEGKKAPKYTFDITERKEVGELGGYFVNISQDLLRDHLAKELQDAREREAVARDSHHVVPPAHSVHIEDLTEAERRFYTEFEPAFYDEMRKHFRERVRAKGGDFTEALESFKTPLREHIVDRFGLEATPSQLFRKFANHAMGKKLDEHAAVVKQALGTYLQEFTRYSNVKSLADSDIDTAVGTVAEDFFYRLKELLAGEDQLGDELLWFAYYFVEGNERRAWQFKKELFNMVHAHFLYGRTVPSSHPRKHEEPVAEAPEVQEPAQAPLESIEDEITQIRTDVAAASNEKEKEMTGQHRVPHVPSDIFDPPPSSSQAPQEEIEDEPTIDASADTSTDEERVARPPMGSEPWIDDNEEARRDVAVFHAATNGKKSATDETAPRSRVPKTIVVGDTEKGNEEMDRPTVPETPPSKKSTRDIEPKLLHEPKVIIRDSDVDPSELIEEKAKIAPPVKPSSHEKDTEKRLPRPSSEKFMPKVTDGPKTEPPQARKQHGRVGSWFRNRKNQMVALGAAALTVIGGYLAVRQNASSTEHIAESPTTSAPATPTSPADTPTSTPPPKPSAQTTPDEPKKQTTEPKEPETEAGKPDDVTIDWDKVDTPELRELLSTGAMDDDGGAYSKQLLNVLVQGNPSREQRAQLKALYQKVNRGAYASAMKKWGHLTKYQVEKKMQDPADPERSLLKSFVKINGGPEKWSRKVMDRSTGTYRPYHEVYSSEMEYYEENFEAEFLAHGLGADGNIHTRQAGNSTIAVKQDGKWLTFAKDVGTIMGYFKEPSTTGYNLRPEGPTKHDLPSPLPGDPADQQLPQNRYGYNSTPFIQPDTDVQRDRIQIQPQPKKATFAKVDGEVDIPVYVDDGGEEVMQVTDDMFLPAEPACYADHKTPFNRGRAYTHVTDKEERAERHLRLPTTLHVDRSRGVSGRSALTTHIRNAGLPQQVTDALLRALDRQAKKSSLFEKVEGNTVVLRPRVKQYLNQVADVAMKRHAKGGPAKIDEKKFAHIRRGAAKDVTAYAMEELTAADIVETNSVPRTMRVPAQQHPIDYLGKMLTDKLAARRKELADNPMNMELIGEISDSIAQVRAICAGMKRRGLGRCLERGKYTMFKGAERDVTWNADTVEKLARVTTVLNKKPAPSAKEETVELRDDEIEYIDDGWDTIAQTEDRITARLRKVSRAA